ncbi:MAG TPA: hypothetical protein VEF03_08275 [Candidatus Binataceae bacterium]|nr:hypothetical protein [Candidatus Binataceae bacterium]
MEDAEQTESPRVSSLVFEAAVAAATLTRWTLLADRDFGDRATRARALMFIPLIGLALGVALGALDRALGAFAFGIRSAIVILAAQIATGTIDIVGVADLIEALRIGKRPASTGLARIGPIGALAALVWFFFATWMLARIANPDGRLGAIVMAILISRWSIVPIAYGLKPLERWGLGVPYAGGLTFREFAVSSVVALGLTMGLYENVGLAVVIASALTILAIRLAISRRLGGASGFALAGGAAICEVAVLATVAALHA